MKTSPNTSLKKLIPSRRKHEYRFGLFAAVLLAPLLFGILVVPTAQADWFALNDEPVIISVKPDLLDAKGKELKDTSTVLSELRGLEVSIKIDGVSLVLKGSAARDFLYLRNYLVYDHASKEWHLTEKYRKGNIQPGVKTGTTINRGTMTNRGNKTKPAGSNNSGTLAGVLEWRIKETKFKGPSIQAAADRSGKSVETYLGVVTIEVKNISGQHINWGQNPCTSLDNIGHKKTERSSFHVSLGPGRSTTIDFASHCPKTTGYIGWIEPTISGKAGGKPFTLKIPRQTIKAGK